MKKTCLNHYCPERTGGECNASDEKEKKCCDDCYSEPLVDYCTNKNCSCHIAPDDQIEWESDYYNYTKDIEGRPFNLQQVEEIKSFIRFME